MTAAYSLEQALLLLEAETQVLHRLLYRNHNQHGTSRLFNYLCRLEKSLTYLPRKGVLNLSKAIEAALRLKPAVTNAEDAAQRLACLSGQQRALMCALECLRFAGLATDICKQQLAAQLFAPLFTTLLVVTARIVTCLGSVLTLLHAQHAALRLQLANACFLSPKVRPVLAAGLLAAALSAQQTRMLDAATGRHSDMVSLPPVPPLSVATTAAPATATTPAAAAATATANATATTAARTGTEDEGIEIGAENSGTMAPPSQ